MKKITLVSNLTRRLFSIEAAVVAGLLLLSSCGGSQVSASGTDAPASIQPAAAENSGDGQNESVAAAEANGESEVKNADGYIFVYNDENVYMDEDIISVLEKLGEPKSTFEAPSCAFEGIDKIFSYTGANIHTYPMDGADFVHTINYMDDSIETPEGIRLGDSLEDVISAYGEDYTEELGQYTYMKNETYLRFLIKDNVVINIAYGLKEYMEQI